MRVIKRAQSAGAPSGAAVPFREITLYLLVVPVLFAIGIALRHPSIWREIAVAAALVILANLAIVLGPGLLQIKGALERERGKMAALLRSIPEGVLEVDSTGIILFANHQLGALFGYPPQDLIGKPIEILVPPGARDAHVQRRDQFLHGAKSRSMGSNLDIHGLRSDGSRFPIDVSLTCVGSSPSIITYCLVRDLTSIKQQQQDLLDANRELVKSVSELERNADQLRRLTEMGELLHSSTSEQELYGIVAHVAQRLFPRISGCIYELKGPRQATAEAACIWGRERNAVRKVIAREDCWTLRNSKAHVILSEDDAPRCRHHCDGARRPTRCVPLLGHGELHGVLHLFAESEDATRELSEETTVRLIQAFANQIALSGANLRLRKHLHEQSLVDPLTGLYNRRAIDEWFEREIRNAIRNRLPLSVLLLDIDHFKRFNDVCGHECGDLALRQLANALRSALRPEDMTCRMGGEEFAVLLPDTPLTGAVKVAENLRCTVERLVSNSQEKVVGPLTVSIGVAALGADGSTIDELLRHADRALYRAKANGRNRVQVSGDGERTKQASVQPLSSSVTTKSTLAS